MLHPHGQSRAPETRGGCSDHRIRSGSRSPSRAPRRRARPLPVAERAQPPAMLRAPWPRGLNLAAARDPAGPGDDGECGARGRGGSGRGGPETSRSPAWRCSPGASGLEMVSRVA